jgi:hypothetical protein
MKQVTVAINEPSLYNIYSVTVYQVDIFTVDIILHTIWRIYVETLKRYEMELEIERAKLNRLFDRALTEPVIKKQELLEQGQKVDTLINKIEEEKEKLRKRVKRHA